MKWFNWECYFLASIPPTVTTDDGKQSFTALKRKDDHDQEKRAYNFTMIFVKEEESLDTTLALR